MVISNKSIRNTRKVAGLVSVTLMIVGSAYVTYYYFWTKQDYDLEAHSDKAFVMDYYMREPSEMGNYRMGRFRSIVMSIQLISSNPVNFLIGFAPGSMIDAKFLARSGNLYSTSGSYFGLGRTQYSRLILGMGFGGLVLAIFLVRALLKHCRQAYRFRDNDAYSVLVMLLILLGIMSAYTVTIYASYYSILVGLLFARVQLYIKNQKALPFMSNEVKL